MGHRTRFGPLARPIALLMLIVLASTPLIASTGDGPCPPTLGGLDAGMANYDVTAGNGTAGNPYIIEDQVIYVGSGGAGIQRRNSDAYYIYRNITIIGTQSGSYGIICVDASNVTIDGLVLRTLTIPLYVVGCHRMRFLNVTAEDCFQGVQLLGTSDCTFVNVSLTGIQSIGLSATGCSYLSFDGCSARNITGGGFKFSIFTAAGHPESRNISLVGCAASDTGLGLSFAGVEGGTIDGCNLTGGWPADVYSKDTRNLTMLDTALGAGGLWVVGTWTGLDVRGSNTVDDLPLRFIDGGDGGVVNSSAGQVILADCQGAIVENLTFQGIAHPVTILGSSGCTVRNCTFMDPYVAVEARVGGLNRVEDLTIVEGGYPYAPYGIDLAYGEMAIEGLNATGLEVAVHAVEGSRLDIANSSFTDGRSHGILAEASQPQSGGSPTRELTVSRCRFQNVTLGIQATDWNLTVRDCRLQACGYVGIFARSTSSTAASGSKVLLERTDVVDCGNTGINLDGIEAQLSSLSVERSSRGILLGSRVLCTVWRCNVSECGVGLYISSAFQVTVSECTFKDCTNSGIQVSYCYRARFHHNNLIRNNYDESSGLYTAPQALDTGGNNEWDDGFEGNYWADYQQWNPDATAIGRVWDTSYLISGNSEREDRYPLTKQYDHMPPIAEAGPEQTVGENLTVTFDGSACSDDLGIVNYTWEFVYRGQPVALYGMTVNHSFSGLATYTVTLTVRDDWGHSASDTTKVYVVDMVAPVAIAGDDLTVDVGVTFGLDGSRSSDDHGIVDHTWTVDPGGLDLVLHGALVMLSFDALGDYAVVLNVSDAHGNWATDSLVVRVRDLSAPTADAGDDVTVPQGSEVALDGAASKDNVGVVEWTWEFTYGGELCMLEGVTVSFVFDVPGDYVVTLTVRDGADKIGKDELVVHVLDTEPPVAVAGEDVTVEQGATVTLSAEGSTDNVGIVQYIWTLMERGVPMEFDGPSFQRIFARAGVFDVTLSAVDAAGNIGRCTVVVTVLDTEAPHADAGPDVVVDQHAVVAFDGTGSYDNVGIVTFTWTLVDGGEDVTLEGLGPERAFDAAGVFEVTLIIADARGNDAADTVLVTVRDTELPVAVAGGNRTALEGGTATLDGSVSSDNVGVIGYSWTVTTPTGTRQLEGRVATLPLDTPGVLTVQLRARDTAGNEGSDAFELTVLSRFVDLVLGPFLDSSGKPVEGVRLKVTLNGTTNNGTTAADGRAIVRVARWDLVSPASVVATKSGWKRLECELAVSDDGTVLDTPPPMVREKGGSPVAVPLFAGAAIIIAAVVALHSWQRRRGGERPS